MRLIFDIEAIASPDIVHCIVARDVDTDEEYVFRPDQLEAGLELLAQADCLIGHNIMGYDLPALKNIFDFDYEGEVRDTLVMCRLIWSDVKNTDFTLYHTGKLPPKMIGSHSLKAWGYRLGELKGEFGEQEDFDVFTEQMLEYCRQDVVVNKHLFSKIESKNYSEDAIKLEHEVHHHLLVQEHLGFPLMSKLAGSCMASCLTAAQRLRLNFKKSFCRGGKRQSSYPRSTIRNLAM